MERNGACPICEGTVGIPADALEGELLICPDCGGDLELIALDPVSLERAPEIQEDWGE
jgi:alpha-aminoadipate carrier protein LysW